MKIKNMGEMVSVREAVLLFRRKIKGFPSVDAFAKFSGEALYAAMALFETHLAEDHLNTFHVVRGMEKTYFWLRIGTAVVNEKSMLPRGFSRGPDGLLKPKYI